MPLDMNVLNFARQFNAQDALPQQGKIDENILESTRNFLKKQPSAEPYEPYVPRREYGPGGLTVEESEKKAALEASQEEARLARAHKALGKSVLPGVKAYAIQAGAGFVSPMARILGKGEYADEMNRWAGAIEHAAREGEEGGVVPDILQRGVRGAGVSLTTMVPAAAVAGPYGAIAAASAQESNQAITEGRDTGLKGVKLAEYAVAQGVWESIPATVMQRVGLGGLESMIGKKSVAVGVREGLKEVGMSLAQEVPEELITELGHAVAAKVAGVDPGALDAKSLKQMVAETTVQTVAAVGMGGVSTVEQAHKVTKAVEIRETIKGLAAEGKVIPRSTWKKLKLPVEKGGKLPPQRVRKEVIQELGGQFEEEDAARAQEEAIAEPTEPTGEPVAPEVSEAAIQPEAVIEALGAPDWISESSVPAVPGETPVPEGFVRVYHYTDMRGIEQTGDEGAHLAGERLRKEGIDIEQAKGGEYGEPNAVWVSTTKPDQGKVYAEMFIAKDDSRWGSFWRDSGPGEGQDAFLTGSISPDEIIGVHEPWHNQYNYLKNDPELLRKAQAGEFDNLLSDPSYGPAVSKVKQETPVAPETAPWSEEAEAQDKEISLTKVRSAELRQELGLEALEPEKVETWDSVAIDNQKSGAIDKAVSVARNAVRNKVQLTTHESMALVDKAKERMDALKEARAELMQAKESGSTAEHRRVTGVIQEIMDEVDLLTRGSRYGRRENARAMNVGKYVASREEFDIASMTEKLQIAKGPKKTPTQEELKLLERTSAKYEEATAKEKQIEEEERIKEEKGEVALAEKVVRAARPRTKIGKAIREKARAEREDVKAQIRALGHRVNDITGVSAEGLYLMGRLGITYVKEGAGTLIEVAERLRADLPDIDITELDAAKALISRSPKEIVRERTEGAKRVAHLKTISTIMVRMDGFARGIDLAVKRDRASVPGEIKKLRKELARAVSKFYESEIDATRLENAIELTNRLSDDLDAGRISMKESPKRREVPPELKSVRGRIGELQSEMRIQREIADINERVRTGNLIMPAKKTRKPVSERLERQQIAVMKARRELQQIIINAQPITAKKVLKEISYSLKAIAATADLSFTLRQNLWQVFAHPVHGARAFGPSLKAFFSEYNADEINNAILHSENSFLYDQSKLAIQDAGSLDAQMNSEVYRGKFIENFKIFGKQNPVGWIMSASSRHAVAFGNLMRTSAFNHFMANNPNATQEEMKMMAWYINVSTGVGDLSRAGAVGDYLQHGFFSPKFAVSRFQTPYALATAYRKGLPRVRNQIAKDMVRTVSTGALVLKLAALAGAEVAGWDPEDPDWGKIRWGNVRFDIWGGFQQPSRVIARTGKKVVTRLGLSEKEERESDLYGILGRFAAFKFSPAITITYQLVGEKTPVGKDITAKETLEESVQPLVLRDIREVWQQEGATKAAVAGAAVMLGIGVSVYEDSESTTRRKMRKFQQAGNKAASNRLKNVWNRKHKDQRIVNVETYPPKKGKK